MISAFLVKHPLKFADKINAQQVVNRTKSTGKQPDFCMIQKKRVLRCWLTVNNPKIIILSFIKMIFCNIPCLGLHIIPKKQRSEFFKEGMSV
jgi:hypothetical protein